MQMYVHGGRYRNINRLGKCFAFVLQLRKRSYIENLQVTNVRHVIINAHSCDKSCLRRWYILYKATQCARITRWHTRVSSRYTISIMHKQQKIHAISIIYIYICIHPLILKWLRKQLAYRKNLWVWTTYLAFAKARVFTIICIKK